MREVEHAHLEVVRQARVGERSGLEALAELVRKRVYPFINRIVLDENKSEDLAQETVVAVLRSVESLKQVDRFWPWMFKIATNVTRLHFRNELRHRAVQMPDLSQLHPASDEQDEGFARLARKELAELTRAAMGKIGMRHRTVLALRFYEDMSHAEVARVLGCTEVTARVTFFQAKRVLTRELKRRGVGKEALAVALAAFAVSTLSRDVSAAPVTVSAAAVSESVWTGLVTANVKAASLLIVAFSACVAMWAGGFGGGGRAGGSQTLLVAEQADRDAADSHAAVEESERGLVPDIHFIHYSAVGNNPTVTDRCINAVCEHWCWLPEGPAGPVLSRSQRWSLDRAERLGRWVHAADASYFIHAGGRVAHILNAKDCCPVHTRVLPTDPKWFCEFLLEVEGPGSHAMVDKRSFTFERDPVSGIVIRHVDLRSDERGPLETVYDYGPLDPGLFALAPTSDMKVLDDRDEIHKRGWAWFRVGGSVGDLDVSGHGRMPFTYEAHRTHPPMLKLNIADRLTVWDDGERALRLDRAAVAAEVYPGGYFFKGLSRTWTSFHILDVIRRDAAGERIWFSAKGSEADGKYDVTLEYDREERYYQAIYTVDLDRDLLDKIEFWTVDDAAFKYTLGRLTFSYLDDETLDEGFDAPDLHGMMVSDTKDRPSILWPLRVLDAVGHGAEEGDESAARGILTAR